MSPDKPKSNLRATKQWQREVARREYLRHPDASIADVARETGVAVRTVARARETLVREGLLPPGRNNPESGADAVALAVAVKALGSGDPPAEGTDDDGPNDPQPADKQAASEASQPAPRMHKTGTVDGEALRQMSQMLDDLADEDDDLTRKRMLKQVKRFAFDPSLHPDTRMSASQLWAKLLDMARTKDLGPGKPLTLAAAIERCTDFLNACGPHVYVPAFYAASGLEMPADGQTSPSVDASSPPSPPAEPAGPPNNDAGRQEQA